MKNCSFAFPLFWLLLFAGPLAAQTEDLTKDEAFFQQQAKAYQRWLNGVGLAPRLSVRDIEVKPQQVALYLQFQSENTDTVSAVWEHLMADYFAQNTGLSLEQALFYKMLQLMELPQSMANVQMYDTYDTGREPCFMWAFYAKDNAFQVDSFGCKASKKMVSTPPGDLHRMNKSAYLDFRDLSMETVFTQVYGFMQARYEGKYCDGRTPVFSAPKIDDNILRFEVTDLCQEAIPASEESLCATLVQFGKSCNWIKREKLSFTWVYQPAGTGFRLMCQIDAKAGAVLRMTA